MSDAAGRTGISSADARDSLLRFSCTELSDAMDRLGISGQCLGIHPLHRGLSVAGRAWTVRYGPLGWRGGTVGDYIDDVPAGDIIVIDNAGRLDATVWGDILTLAASQRGVAGTVIDGVCRDVPQSPDLSYPVFSRGSWMRTGKDRVQVESIGSPVSAGGVRVEPGDWIRGDGDGVVSIPAIRLQEVIDTAETIQQAENRIRDDVKRGVPLREARIAHGYHQLQRARPEGTAGPHASASSTGNGMV